MSAFGVKRTSSFFYRRSRCANADRHAGGSPSQRCASVRVSSATNRSRSMNNICTSSGDTRARGSIFVRDGFCLRPRRLMAGKSTGPLAQVNGPTKSRSSNGDGMGLSGRIADLFTPVFTPEQFFCPRSRSKNQRSP
jgi:hypothetical protein